MHHLLVLGPLGAVLILGATSAAKRLGRWLEGAAKRSFEAAVDDAMAPRFVSLERKLDHVQEQNRADHGAVAKRMSAVEAELADVKARLADVEAAVTGKGAD